MNETIWLTQKQIAELFGTKRPAITKHLKNIFASGELEEKSTCSILEHMGNKCYSIPYLGEQDIERIFSKGVCH
jgi:hypothetical protein